jgi:hypothetical protein
VVLARLEPLAQRREVVPSDYALLYDRVAMFEGRPQRCGTQLICPKGGRFDYHLIEDRANADARRARLGLEPLAEYAKNFPEFGRPCG